MVSRGGPQGVGNLGEKSPKVRIPKPMGRRAPQVNNLEKNGGRGILGKKPTLTLLHLAIKTALFLTILSLQDEGNQWKRQLD